MDKYIKCPKCAKLCNYKENHFENCTVDEPIINYVNGINLCCYTCGRKDVNYSPSELENPEKARCRECESSCITERCYKYDYLWSARTDQIHKLDLNKQLLYYTNEWNIPKMKEVLEKGANPNYEYIQDYYRGHGRFYLLYYNEDGSEMFAEDKKIRDSAINYCITEFRFCENDKQRNKIIEMAKLLIEFGADKIKGKEKLETYLSKSLAQKDVMRWNFYSLFE